MPWMRSDKVIVVPCSAGSQSVDTSMGTSTVSRSASLGFSALIGIGVSACLMAPLTAFRRSFEPQVQLRANSWMLMSGSLGMVASTLPVQWMMPLLGWRGLFWLIAALLTVSMAAIAACVPSDPRPRVSASRSVGYADIWRQRTFLRFAPLAFFHYGGMIAVQSLWAGPWLTAVTGRSAGEAAQGPAGPSEPPDQATL